MEPCKGVTGAPSVPRSFEKALIHLISWDVMLSPFRARLSCSRGHTQGDALGYHVFAPSGRIFKKHNLKAGASGSYSLPATRA
jgi:hypothetical protein